MRVSLAPIKMKLPFVRSVRKMDVAASQNGFLRCSERLFRGFHPKKEPSQRTNGALCDVILVVDARARENHAAISN